MTTWIVLLRGINVGGHNRLPMKSLVADLESLGLTRVQTYIQSGNVVCDGPRAKPKVLAAKIAAAIERRRRFKPGVLLLRPGELRAAIDANPFSTAAAQPQSLHFFFLETAARKPNRAGIEAAKSATEKYALTNDVFYLYAPEGIGRSKLAASLERLLGVAATGRNHRTVEKLRALSER